MDEPAKLDGAAKQRVKDALEAHAIAEIGESGQAVSNERSAAELDHDSSYANDDLSQSDAAAELNRLLEAAEEKQRADLARIETLDLGPKEVVEPGAVIAFGGDYFVVGVVASAFECDGVTYEGISEESPIYQAIAGLRTGETFSFNGHQHRVDLVC